MEHKQFNEPERRARYFDKNGEEILTGMTLRNDKGEEQKVYECGDQSGSSNLGFLASNPRFLETHPDWPAEYYPLHQFNLADWQIVVGDALCLK